MVRSLAPLLFLLAAVPAFAQGVPEPPPPPPPVESVRPPYFSCRIERTDPIGTVAATEFVFPNGTRDGQVFSWEARRDPEGIRLEAVWGIEGPEDGSFVQIDYSGTLRDDVYRIQVRRYPEQESGVLLLQSGLIHPEDGMLHIFTEWGPLAAVVTGAPDPRLVIVDAEGNVVRSDPIDKTAFGRVAGIAAGLRPELEALVADYRNRCEFVETLGIAG